MAAAAMMSALKAAPGAMQMASMARSLAPAVKKQAPAAMKNAAEGISQALPAAANKIAKGNPAMSGAMSALAKATPHLSALTQKQGLGSTLLNSFKALRELRGVTRELSKMPAPGASATGKSETGKAALAKPDTAKHATGKSGAAASTGGVKVMIGRPEKNWEKATAENGFRELGGAKGDAARAKGVKIMIGRPQKNWEDATKKNGFRELGGKSGKAARAHGVKIMIGRPQKNWEEATAENGFRELGSRKSPADGNAKGKSSAKASLGFRLIVGRVKDKGKDGDAQGGMRIQISFARNGASSGMADKRVGELSISLHGAAAASKSRKRVNSFDGQPTQRKHSHSFPTLDRHSGSKARHRSTPPSFGRGPPGFSLTIGFSMHGLSPPARKPSGTQHGGRQRAHTI